jgi:hypothetical protein
LAAFDSAVHFFAVRGGEAQPQLLVMSDVTDVFAPGGVAVKWARAQDGSHALSDQLPDLCWATPNVVHLSFPHTALTQFFAFNKFWMLACE